MNEPKIDRHGRRTFSGEGGGYLAFPSHSNRPAIGWVGFREMKKHEAELLLIGRDLTDNDAAVEERFSDAVIEALDNHALVAIRMLEALKRGDTGYFSTLVVAMKAGKIERPAAKAEEEERLRSAIMDAAETAGGVPPTREQVIEAFRYVYKGPGEQPDAAIRSDKMQAKLESIGFGWLEHRERGDTLRGR